jgi:hypothetical protein
MLQIFVLTTFTSAQRLFCIGYGGYAGFAMVNDMNLSFKKLSSCLLNSSRLFAFLVFLIAQSYGTAWPQFHHCDTHLIQPENNPYGYRLRGDRCEGQYVQQVASTTLVVASFTNVFENYNLEGNFPLRLKWPALGTNEVRLRAHSLRWKLYYRMDSLRNPGDTNFVWPITLLAAMKVSKRDLGVVSLTQYQLGDILRPVYLPLQITQKKTLASSSSYHLVLWPGVQLQEVYLSLATVDDEGQPKEFLVDGKPLLYGYYPAQRAIDIPIFELQESGIYYVEIGATLQSGKSYALDLFFYRP